MYSLKERIIALTIVVAVFVGVAFIIRNNGKNHLPNGDHVVRITNTGERYHYASCSYLHSSSIKITIKEAYNQGYRSCSRCDPPEYISEEAYNEQRANRHFAFMVIISLFITGLTWSFIYSIVKEFSGDWFIYILFAIAYCIVLITVYRWY